MIDKLYMWTKMSGVIWHEIDDQTKWIKCGLGKVLAGINFHLEF